MNINKKKKEDEPKQRIQTVSMIVPGIPSGGSSSLAVQEVDGAPNVSNVTRIRVTNGTLTDNGGGDVTISIGGAALNDPGANGIVVRTALNTTTARSIASGAGNTVTNNDGTAGNPTVTWSPDTFVNNITLWDSANASRTLTAGLSGATDPVLTFSNNLINVTTGAFQVGGAAVLVNGGALGTPSSGTLTNCTGLPISTGVSGLAAGIATFLATPSSANLATAVTDETGSGALVFATSPTLVTPVLGTPTSGNLANCTGYPMTSVTGSRRLSVLRNITLDAAVFPTSIGTQITAATAPSIGTQLCYVLVDAGADAGLYFNFPIPKDYVNSPVLVVRGVLDGAPSVGQTLGFGFRKRAVADNEAADGTFDAEQTVSTNISSSGTNHSDEDEVQLTISLTAGDYAADDNVYGYLYIDASGTTYAGNFLLTDILFQYN